MHVRQALGEWPMRQERWDSVLGVFEDLKATPGVGRIPYAAYAFAMEALEQQRSEDDSRCDTGGERWDKRLSAMGRLGRLGRVEM